MVNQTIQRLEPSVSVGWTIGSLGHGVYYRPADETLNQERSFVIEILGVGIDFVDQVAEALRQAFNQEVVVVVDNSTNTSKLLTS
jgi:hypothetical protein